MSDMRIPMSSPDIGAAERQAVQEVLNGMLSIGPNVAKFEAAAAQYMKCRYGIGVSSGTAALHLAVIAAGLSDTDCAITTPFSFVASANCLLYERAIPVFVDVDPVTGNIDPHLVEEAAACLAAGGSKATAWLPPSIRDRNTVALKAILPVHTFGQPAAMDELTHTARRFGLCVIEDACEAIGAEYKGRKAGSFGRAAALAFYPNKQITTGEGGMLLTSDAEWDALFRSLRNQGRDVFDAWLAHSRLGYNYRLDEMSAALGLVQITRIHELMRKRETVAEWYTARLAPHADLVEPPVIVETTTRMSWFVYVVRLNPHVDRTALMKDLEAQSIPSRPYFTPIHLQPFYRDRFGYQPGDFPVCESLGRRSLALPFSGVMNEEQVDLVCTTLLESARRHRAQSSPISLCHRVAHA